MLLAGISRRYMVTLNWGERDIDAGTAAMLVNSARFSLCCSAVAAPACLPFAG